MPLHVVQYLFGISVVSLGRFAALLADRGERELLTMVDDRRRCVGRCPLEAQPLAHKRYQHVLCYFSQMPGCLQAQAVHPAIVGRQEIQVRRSVGIDMACFGGLLA